jgi:hypothetical protein
MFLIIKDRIKNFKADLSRNNLILACSLIFILNLLVYSKWWAWYGNAWVYRMIVDTMPYLSLAMIPALESNFFKKSSSKVVFIVLLTFSVYMQALGAFSFDYTWESRRLISYKDYNVWFNLKDSSLVSILSDQKYYVRNPHRTVYVLGDKFGDSINFKNNKINVTGNKKVAHAVFMNLGQNPELIGGNLISDHYAEGVSFFITPSYLGCNLNLKVSFDMNKTQQNAGFQIRELENGSEASLTKLQVADSVDFTLKNNAEEIRVQNDAVDDVLAIKSIVLSCINSSK